MKLIFYISSAFLLLVTTSCVQKTNNRIVVYTLDVSSIKDIKKVGIRGWDSPLSWNSDYAMKELIKDSLYTVIVSSKTGRICNEFKFSVNDKIEFEDGENRKIYFDNKSDTTKVSFVFNEKSK
jgi:hypothetical protein